MEKTPNVYRRLRRKGRGEFQSRRVRRFDEREGKLYVRDKAEFGWGRGKEGGLVLRLAVTV